MSNTNEDQFVRKFAKKIIKTLEEGTAPWQRPWKGGRSLSPKNHVSGTIYSGGNKSMLFIEQHLMGVEDNRWMTQKQAQKRGWKVKEGQLDKGFLCSSVFPIDRKIDPKVLKLHPDEVKKGEWGTRHFLVYHASQIEGIPKLKIKKNLEVSLWEACEKGEAIIHNSHAVIKPLFMSNPPHYIPSLDTIFIQGKDQFPSDEAYYGTILHELAHWTGHPKRLNRDMSGDKNSAQYAKEELRAEIGAWMVAVEVGIPYSSQAHASYVQSWIKVLQKDPQEIVRACKDAQKISKYLQKFLKNNSKRVA